MFIKRHGPPGTPPATLSPHLVDGKIRKPSIQLIEYDGEHIEEREITDISELAAHLDNNKMTWINIDGLGDTEALTLLGEKFNLHPLALEDVLNTGQRPKVESSSDYVFVVAQMVYQDASRTIRSEQISLFFGENFLISVQEEGEYDVFDPIRARLRGGRGKIRKSKADYLAYALLDSVIDHFYPVLEELGGNIEDLEDDLLEKPSREMVRKLHEHKRSLTQLRRFVCVILIGAGVATRENDALQIAIACIGAQPILADIARMYLAKHMCLAHAAGNQLGNLRTEVQYQYFLVRHRVNGGLQSAR